MNKKWIRSVFFMSFIFMFIGGLINFILDPLQQYREAKLYKPYYSNERYMNPGIAKNYKYNSVIVGSSMVENFKLSNVESILGFDNPIKLSVAGASAYELKLTMDIVQRTHTIKDILYGLDIYSFYGKPERTSHPLPMYLYDNNIWNDFKYLLSLDAMKETGKFAVAQVMKKNDPKLDINTMYQWQHLYENSFGSQKVLEQWNINNKNHKNKVYSYDMFIASFNANFLQLLEQFPETNFYVFYPPYSILAYKNMKNMSWLKDFLKFKIYIYNVTQKYKNIKLYDFQLANEIIYNLDNYKDITHYHQDINLWMLHQMKNNKYLVNSIEKARQNNQKIVDKVNKYKIPLISYLNDSREGDLINAVQ